MLLKSPQQQDWTFIQTSFDEEMDNNNNNCKDMEHDSYDDSATSVSSSALLLFHPKKTLTCEEDSLYARFATLVLEPLVQPWLTGLEQHLITLLLDYALCPISS